MARPRPPLEVSNLSQTLVQSKGQGMSAFFPSSPTQPTTEKKTLGVSPAPSEPERAQETLPIQPNPAIPERSNARTPERIKGKRIMTRNSFETYEDQMESLRKLSFREKMEGKVGSMSAMVRDAIDDYLEKRSQEI